MLTVTLVSQCADRARWVNREPDHSGGLARRRLRPPCLDYDWENPR